MCYIRNYYYNHYYHYYHYYDGVASTATTTSVHTQYMFFLKSHELNIGC